MTVSWVEVYTTQWGDVFSKVLRWSVIGFNLWQAKIHCNREPVHSWLLICLWWKLRYFIKAFLKKSHESFPPGLGKIYVLFIGLTILMKPLWWYFSHAGTIYVVCSSFWDNGMKQWCDYFIYEMSRSVFCMVLDRFDFFLIWNVSSLLNWAHYCYNKNRYKSKHMTVMP